MSSSHFKYVFKYIIIGNPSVGKSCILNQFLNNTFSDEYEITVGIEFGAKTIEIESGEKVKLQIWDTAGQESFKSITRAYYRTAAAALLVYDITSRDSFEAISNWLEECKVNGNPEMTLILIGNKTNLAPQRQVSFAEGEAFAQKNGMIFIETSAKTDSRIAEAFTKSASAVNQKINKGTIDPKNEMDGVKLGPTYSVNESTFLKTAAQPKKSGGDCC